MKRLFLAIISACLTLTLAAQGGIRVNYQGANPTIGDYAWASYALPRSGKDITVTYWKDGSKKQKTLKWNGRQFSL